MSILEIPFKNKDKYDIHRGIAAPVFRIIVCAVHAQAVIGQCAFGYMEDNRSGCRAKTSIGLWDRWFPEDIHA